MAEEKQFTCFKCQVPLEPTKTHFKYMVHVFHADVLRCPVCGQVLIDEELAKGRMAQVEQELEDK